jgi:hypothetical protein
MGIEWEYEKEGYKLEDGTCYLPDFWLPEVETWAEVKGKAFTTEEERKCRLLAQGTRRDVVLLAGIPECKTYDCIHPLPMVGRLDTEPALLYLSFVEGHKQLGLCVSPDNCEGWDKNINYAGELARAARFEFGECERPGEMPAPAWFRYSQDLSAMFDCYANLEIVSDNSYWLLREFLESDMGFMGDDLDEHATLSQLRDLVGAIRTLGMNIALYRKGKRTIGEVENAVSTTHDKA